MIHFFTPRAETEDGRRREFILYVLLIPSVVLFAAATLFAELAYLADPQAGGMGVLVLAGLTAFLIALYAVARRGAARPAAYIFIAAFFLLPLYGAFNWGVDLPAGILFFVLCIVMAGVLLGTRAGVAMTILVCVCIAGIAALHQSGIAPPDRSWASNMWRTYDVLAACIIFLIIAAVSWLSNREIERSHSRLEARVTERTAELRKAEMENMRQSYRFIEFGRLASGVFHDLTNPLASLALNVEALAHHGQGTASVMTDDIARAKRATAHMQKIIDGMRRHLAREGKQATFTPLQALQDIADILGTYARSRGVRIEVSGEGVETYGDRAAFTQAMTNLLSNAVESYAAGTGEHVVRVRLGAQSSIVTITIQDWGEGMGADVLGKIFEPFFTTKTSGEGVGIGLPLAKRVIETDFGGSISVISAPGEGTTFTVTLPLKHG